MFVANPTDPSLSLIRYVGTPGPSVPVRHAVSVVPATSSYRTQAGHLVTVAGLALAAAVAGFGAGYLANASSGATTARVLSVEPAAGEFRLGPGLDQPPGIASPVGSGIDVRPVPGEFRLAPGNARPVGVAVAAG